MASRSPLKSAILVALVVVLALGGSTACKKKPVETAPPPPPPSEPAKPAPPPPAPPPKPDFPTEKPAPIVETEPTIDELNRQRVLRTVYFDYDKSDLTDATRQTLQQNAQWLKTNTRYRVVIEGHCDERGTIDYNLALGERRANSVRQYLTSLGVDAGRMRIKSYGEERPAMLGSNEQAWRQNRRGEFVIE